MRLLLSKCCFVHDISGPLIVHRLDRCQSAWIQDDDSEHDPLVLNNISREWSVWWSNTDV